MAKADVRSVSLQAWNEYEGKPAAEALQAIYKHASDNAQTRCKWYWDSIKTKRRASLAILIMSFVLLGAGTLLPILAGVWDKPDVRLGLTQIGVVVLAAAGLLQIVNRVLGLSSGWLRYMATVTAMENATRKFEMDWATYIVGKKGVLTADDLAPLLQIAEQFETDIAKQQSDETNSWITEFSRNVAQLSEMVDKQRELGEKRVEEAFAQQRKGALEVALTGNTTATSVTIDVDGVKTQFSGQAWANPDVPPGRHVLTVTANDNPAHTVQRIVDVPPGGIARQDIAL